MSSGGAQRGERGQTAIELLGLLLLIGALVAVVTKAGLGERVACGTKAAVAKIAGTGSPSCGGRGSAPRPRGATPLIVPPGLRAGAIGASRNRGLAPIAKAAKRLAPGEQPAKPLWPEWKPNGCSKSPDSGGYFDFGSACNGHDKCYAQQRGKTFCDSGFKKAMYRDCKGRKFIAGSACRRTADAYHQAVKQFGGDAYEHARDKAPKS